MSNNLAVAVIGVALTLALAAAFPVRVVHAAEPSASSPARVSSSDAQSPTGDPAQAVTGQSTTQAQNGASPATAKAKVTKLQTVQVTGSHIARPAVTASVNIHVLTPKSMRLTGAHSIVQVLSKLPDATTVSSANNNSENSFSTVALHGFGPNRTLVLINGQRVVTGDVTAFSTGNKDFNGANLNFLPNALIQRVEILTGGASAIYGSDAIAGVVNFIIKNNFNGFQFDTQLTQPGKGDGSVSNSTLLWGATTGNGNGNVELYFNYMKQNPVFARNRFVSHCPWLPSPSGVGHVCFGSSIAVNPKFTVLSQPPGHNLVDLDPNGARKFVPIPIQGGPLFNFDQFSYLQRPVKRYRFGGFGHRQINDHLRLAGGVMFMTSANTMHPGPPDLGGHFSINCSNPLLSNQQRTFLCPNPNQTSSEVILSKRLRAWGPRETTDRNTEYRINLDARGEIVPGWRYSIGGVRSVNLTEVIVGHQYASFNVQRGLNVITDSNGQPACVYTTNPCVPFDLFSLKPFTQAEIQYIRGGEGIDHAMTAQTVFHVGANGDLGVHSPLATGDLQFAGGLDYRRESLNYRPGLALQNGNIGESAPVSGRYNVAGAFSEFRAPLIQNRPFVKSLVVDLAYRLSRYRIFTRKNRILTHVYGINIRYAPSSDFAIRGSWSRSVRAPDIEELFSPISTTSITFQDPCSGVNPTAPLAQCENTGVTPAQYGAIRPCPSTQCASQIGGNVNLNPERSISREIGVVFTPQFLPHFNATVDYYDIALQGAIGAIPAPTVLGLCLTHGEFCNKVQRGPSGQLFGGTHNNVFVSATDINTGVLIGRGINVTARWTRNLADLGLGNIGGLALDLNGTYVLSFKRRNTPGAPEYDCSGLYGPVCGTPRPHWRDNLRATWSNLMAIAGLSLSANWEFIGKTSLDQNKKSLQLNPTGAAFDAPDAKLPNVSYFDLVGTYTLPFGGNRVRIRAGCNNVTDKKPPIISLPVSATFSNQTAPSGTFANLYNTLGRIFFLGVDVNFGGHGG